ncbi:Protein transport protein Sec24-like CEF [Vitis vinifera]|uniref:Protein transport protein Sec24-like CEF n=1 Tax=Vitis vinifera TaxID=29760 RepID=A0A438IS58_VITVI|nr:Protein transport protein Sec24-like CEF [Vitis vinifera]
MSRSASRRKVVPEPEVQGAPKAQALVKASLCPLQPDAGEEEKEKKEVGDLGAPVDCVAPCAPKWRLREGHRLPSGKVVDFGESGPVRCSRCKGYINPFMKFIDQGRRFICNLCGEYKLSDLLMKHLVTTIAIWGPDGRRRDAEERPELCRGTVEFVASKEYMMEMGRMGGGGGHKTPFRFENMWLRAKASESRLKSGGQAIESRKGVALKQIALWDSKEQESSLFFQMRLNFIWSIDLCGVGVLPKERESLLKRAIIGKFGEEGGGWCSSVLREAWLESKSGKFLVEAFYFPCKNLSNTCNICMGSNVGKDFDLGFSKKERVFVGNKCYICEGKKNPLTIFFCIAP